MTTTLSRLKSALRDSQILSRRSLRSLKFDALRLRARLLHQWRTVAPAASRLHLGCGSRRVPGWLNVDVSGSEYDVDLGCGSLPWPSESFDVVVSQQVIEHLELDSQLLPLLRELRRVLRPGGDIWLSSPDMERVCNAYFCDRGRSLEVDRQSRWPRFALQGKPPQHMINVLFHQAGEHLNLFDFEFLAWTLGAAGFAECVRTSEAQFLARFPDFPRRNDDASSVYVRARVPQAG